MAAHDLSTPAQLEATADSIIEKLKRLSLKISGSAHSEKAQEVEPARRGDAIIDQAMREKSPMTRVGLVLSTATSTEAVAPEPSLSKRKIPLLVS